MSEEDASGTPPAPLAAERQSPMKSWAVETPTGLMVGAKELRILEKGRPLNGVLVEMGIHQALMEGGWNG